MLSLVSCNVMHFEKRLVFSTQKWKRLKLSLSEHVINNSLNIKHEKKGNALEETVSKKGTEYILHIQCARLNFFLSVFLSFLSMCLWIIPCSRLNESIELHQCLFVNKVPSRSLACITDSDVAVYIFSIYACVLVIFGANQQADSLWLSFSLSFVQLCVCFYFYSIIQFLLSCHIFWSIHSHHLHICMYVRR